MSTATVAATPVDQELAQPLQRFWAWVLDAAIASVALSPILVPTILISRSKSASTGLTIALFIVLELAGFAYLVAFDGGARGATPGKRIVGIRVVDNATHGRINYRRAAVRRLVYIVGGLAFYIGWLWVLIDPGNQALHDKAADTLVIKAA